MALKKFFKGKEEKAKEAVKPEKKEMPEAAPEETEAEKRGKASLPVRQAGLLPERVLKIPRVTEKASVLAERNQYVFEVHPQATKPAVREAVEQLYGVNVEGVRMVRLPRKKTRFRRQEGMKPAVKKALVKVQEGQKIDLLPI